MTNRRMNRKTDEQTNNYKKNSVFPGWGSHNDQEQSDSTVQPIIIKGQDFIKQVHME